MSDKIVTIDSMTEMSFWWAQCGELPIENELSKHKGGSN
jgi:hypothetical protein